MRNMEEGVAKLIRTKNRKHTKKNGEEIAHQDFERRGSEGKDEVDKREKGDADKHQLVNMVKRRSSPGGISSDGGEVKGRRGKTK